MKQFIDISYRSEHPVLPTFHSHIEYEIFYFHEGQCTYLIGDQIHRLQPGDLIVMHGMTLHCAKMVEGEDYVRSVIHFDPSFYRPLLEQLQISYVLQPFEALRNHRINLSHEKRIRMEEFFATLQNIAQQGTSLSAAHYRLVMMELMIFIYKCFQQPLQNHRSPSSHREDKVELIMQFIENNYKEDIHLDDLEQHLHMSKHYMAKLFKEITGVTIFEYLYERRINQARMLFLTKTDKSVTDICFEVGFKHPAHFSRTFKAKVGMTPEKYRKHIKLASAPPSEDISSLYC